MRELSELLTVSQAAREIGVSSVLVRLWVRTGRMPATRTPYGSLIDPEEVARVIEERQERAAGRLAR